jgi:hypothetical protein
MNFSLRPITVVSVVVMATTSVFVWQRSQSSKKPVPPKVAAIKTVLTKEDCLKCFGDGYVGVKDLQTRGVENVQETEGDCDRCDGKGKVTVSVPADDQVVDCTVCNGDGKTTQNEMNPLWTLAGFKPDKCAVCIGSGKGKYGDLSARLKQLNADAIEDIEAKKQVTPIKELYAKCARCEGSGEIKDSKIPNEWKQVGFKSGKCVVCLGTGRLNSFYQKAFDRKITMEARLETGRREEEERRRQEEERRRREAEEAWRRFKEYLQIMANITTIQRNIMAMQLMQFQGEAFANFIQRASLFQQQSVQLQRESNQLDRERNQRLSDIRDEVRRKNR